MPTPISYLSGNTLSYQSGMVKKGTIGLNLTSSLTGNYKWWNGVDATSSQYLIYSDTYSTGASSEANVTPAAWSTPDLTDQSLLNLINTLPDRVGQTAFTTLSNALIWLNQSGKYFVVKNGYENLVTSGLTLNLDAGWTNSYSGTTSWYDISGNGKVGTLTNGPAFNSGNTGSIYFDGSDDFCVVPNSSLNGLSSGSISVWVKFLNLNFQYVLSLPNTSGNNGFDILIENNKLDSYLSVTTGGGSTGSQFVPKLGIWYNIVTTYDGTSHKLFVNGVLISSASRSGTIQNGIGQTFLGRFSSGFGAYSNNYTSNAQLYNRALSQTEILQNYQLYKNRFGYDVVENGLVLNLNSQNYVSYRETGTSWYDLTGNNNTGTLTNGPTFDSTTRGIVFDGVDDYCTFSNLPTGFQAGMTNYSISIWFKLNSAKEAPLLEIGNTSNDLQRIMFWLTSGSPNRLYALGASLNSQYRYSSVYLTVGNVYNAVYTYNNTGTVSKLYINGVEDTGLTNQTTNGLLTSLSNTWKIGADSVYGQTFCQNANIYNVLLYTKTLTSQEVLQNYYQGNIVTNGLIMNLDAGNLVSYGGTGTTWYDISGNNNHCTLYNGITYSNGILTLDGIDDYIKTTNNLDLSTTNAVTILYFLQPTTYGTAVKIIHELSPDFNSNSNCFVSAFSDNSLGQNYEIFASSRGNAGYNIAVYDKSMLNDLKWHHLTIIHDNSQVSKENVMYNNTDLGPEIQNPYPGYGNNNTNNFANQPFYIGSRAGSAYFTPMKVGQILMYNRRLTQSEIIQNFNAHKSRYGL